ncbi:adenosine deaminase [bacterium (Candidatus Blackallbacteria) CG17_big_fil_post_rev_8_21_14_2_50_48_46]|uniref:Adenosine deaminase n=1 Tax=bacterium (Candidatus Blackallbacteria) CG17_big_fil_post_rev_8_21_14_2_50_48_46 TaxID=2014261 RepID=A0A2M7G3R3_9BACT|nr:MAG: adenosine deaminase [bacterium (Candidatus Blackallbacteria) CG18_big_fil_WC_8_21_14_2_50_49_26]PIW16118.1 MAG: adenosine deaminase [bacterium (Candidatus Blackallbacteria) CG17_big_fil_post_rev_8_21_14_2_50_48_46]PIW45767.1 MAG: adenosine deaminase [bacterium (Candidatus Blackallbacteria) CG13_big_fil_rev_8_21_14_2_50_49_14]
MPKQLPTRDILLQLPKTDLHVHLDGSMRIETMLELAAKQGVELPASDAESLRKLVQVAEDCQSLEEYLRAFDITLSVLQEFDALRRTAFELAEDAAQENVKYIEVRFCPLLHTQKGLSMPQIVKAVLQGLADAERQYDIITGVIICGIRHISPESSLDLAGLTISFKNRGVVAFDLAGAEYDNPAKDHKEAFELILNENINCTVHAGEAFGPKSISQAIHYCGAHRIGHGTRLIEDRDMLNYVNDHRIPLEICLTSNLQTKAIDKLEHHPLKKYYDLGLRVTINTDNRLISNTTVTDELYLASQIFDLDLHDIANILINGFKSAFLPHNKKTRMLRSVMAELDEILGVHRSKYGY